MVNLHDDAEYQEAMRQLICQLDVPDRILRPIRTLVTCSLGRIFWNDWRNQDEHDAEWMPTPGDDDDPAWHRIDGWPELGGDQLHRKWSRRADLWTQWHSVDAWHVMDWLICAHSEGQPWIANIDTDGQPKKLMKCHTLEQLVREATKGLRQRNIKDIVLGPSDETFVLDLGAGHTLVRLLSRSALRLEGLRMHHCIGHGGYDAFLVEPDRAYYSVRDMNGKPKATLEIHQGFIRQIRGPANAKPTDALMDLTAPVFDAFGWRPWGERPTLPVDRSEYGAEAVAILPDLPPARARDT